MPDNGPAGPQRNAIGPVSIYLSDVLDLERLAGSDTLDLALKSDGPFAVAGSADGGVYLNLPFIDDRISFSMALSAEVARELAAELRRCVEGGAQTGGP